MLKAKNYDVVLMALSGLVILFLVVYALIDGNILDTIYLLSIIFISIEFLFKIYRK